LSETIFFKFFPEKSVELCNIYKKASKQEENEKIVEKDIHIKKFRNP